MSLKKPYFSKTGNSGFMRLCLMRGRMPTPFLVGNVVTATRETLLHGSVQDHRRSDFIYSSPCSKAGSALCVLALVSTKVILRNYEHSKYISVPLKKIQIKFWGCSLKVLWTGRKKLPSSSQQTFMFLKTLPWFAKSLIIFSAPKWALHLSCNLQTKWTKHSRPEECSLCTVFDRASHTYHYHHRKV